MKPNEGKTDRIIRIILGVGLVAGGFFMSGWPAIVLWIAGGIALITGLTGFCGLYVLMGINTCKVQK